MPQHRFHVVTREGGLQRLGTAAEAIAARGDGRYVWLDYVRPEAADLTALVEPLGIHPLSVEDCLDDEQIPKIENFPASSFLLVNTTRFTGSAIVIGEADFMVGKDFLVTVGCEDVLGAAFFLRLEESVRLDLEGVREGPDALAYLILDHIVDGKSEAVEALQDEIDRLEEKILQDPALFHPADLMRLRRQLLTMRKCLFHEREVLVKICRRDSPFVGEKSVYHFRDVYDHLAKFFELTEIAREMITSLMEMYLSSINNQMAASANRTNRTMRRLTLITTIFMPLTLLTGIFGMSEWTQLTGGPDNWPYAYLVFALGMAVISLGTYVGLRWAEKRPPPKHLSRRNGGGR